jgi:hypothetical protein
MSRYKDTGQSLSVKTSLERVKKFKYFGKTLVNQNSIQEEIKSILKSEDSCEHSVQNVLSSSLLFRIVKVKVFRTIILPVV